MAWYRCGPAVMLIAAVGWSGGCDGMGSLTPNLGNSEPVADEDAPVVTLSGGLVPMAHPPITDLPVPIGFKLDDSISRTYEFDQIRVVDHTYEGYASRDEVQRFYRKQMPMHGWQELDATTIRGETTLHLVRGEETCNIELTSRPTLSGERVTITVDIHGTADLEQTEQADTDTP